MTMYWSIGGSLPSLRWPASTVSPVQGPEKRVTMGSADWKASRP
jgi:hypothetical protein